MVFLDLLYFDGQFCLIVCCGKEVSSSFLLSYPTILDTMSERTAHLIEKCFVHCGFLNPSLYGFFPHSNVSHILSDGIKKSLTSICYWFCSCSGEIS